MVRVAVIEKERCKPKDCNRECIRFCPPVRSGHIETVKLSEATGKASISEVLCIGCGICVRKCPFGAISIVNLPDELEGECSHRYGVNAFRLFRLPMPKPGQILGLIGANGTGKSTALQIMAGTLKPNLGRVGEETVWSEITKFYRGSELQSYFEQMGQGRLKAVMKPQNIGSIPRAVKGEVGLALSRIDERGVLNEVKDELELGVVWDRTIDVLSGGELQRVAIAATCLREAEAYFFDEPSSHLDVYQRVRAVRLIKSLRSEGKWAIVVEHDIALLDYLSDNVCILYGQPGVYGIVSPTYGVRVGINIYLDGYLPSENVRFRDQPVRFHLTPVPMEWTPETRLFSWPALQKQVDSFNLKIKPGEVHVGEVVGVLGANGIGKTTFVRMLAGQVEPDEGHLPQRSIRLSYKPQYVEADYDGTVESILRSNAAAQFSSSLYETTILQPLDLQRLLDRDAASLSGGELQRVAIASCLSKDAELYLLDEPTAYLDVEQRLNVTRTVKRVVESKGAAAFVVEHDIIAQDFLATSLMAFTGEPGKQGIAHPPTGLRQGMNSFLAEMGITFRRDFHTGRPRVNKEGSYADRSQKERSEYYYIPLREEKEEAE